MGVKRELSGQRFGKLTVVDFAGSRRTSGGGSKRTWNCLCDCGKLTTLDTGALVSGNTSSCGCYALESKTRHGMHETRFYQVWEDMKSRCDNPATKCYERYGGRGIVYDTNWKDFLSFKQDMFTDYEDNLTLDRIDPNGDYSRGNCQWITKQDQARNRTMMVTNKTGVNGIREWVDSKNGSMYIVAEAQHLSIKKAKHFSVNKYGYDKAFDMACNQRDLFMIQFSEAGVVFSEYHGKEKA